MSNLPEAISGFELPVSVVRVLLGHASLADVLALRATCRAFSLTIAQAITSLGSPDLLEPLDGGQSTVALPRVLQAFPNATKLRITPNILQQQASGAGSAAASITHMILASNFHMHQQLHGRAQVFLSLRPLLTFQKLQCLEVQDCMLRDTPDALCALRRLTVLDLSGLFEINNKLLGMLLKMTWLKSLALPAPGCHSPRLNQCTAQGVHIALSSFSSLTGFHLKSVNLEAHGPDTVRHALPCTCVHPLTVKHMSSKLKSTLRELTLHSLAEPTFSSSTASSQQASKPGSFNGSAATGPSFVVTTSGLVLQTHPHGQLSEALGLLASLTRLESLSLSPHVGLLYGGRDLTPAHSAADLQSLLASGDYAPPSLNSVSGAGGQVPLSPKGQAFLMPTAAHCGLHVSDSLVAALAHGLPQLQTLELVDCWDLGCAALDAIATLPGLTSLDLSGSCRNLAAEELSRLQPLGDRLCVLRLSRWGLPAWRLPHTWRAELAVVEHKALMAEESDVEEWEVGSEGSGLMSADVEEEAINRVASKLALNLSSIVTSEVPVDAVSVYGSSLYQDLSGSCALRGSTVDHHRDAGAGGPIGSGVEHGARGLESGCSRGSDAADFMLTPQRKQVPKSPLKRTSFYLPHLGDAPEESGGGGGFPAIFRLSLNLNQSNGGPEQGGGSATTSPAMQDALPHRLSSDVMVRLEGSPSVGKAGGTDKAAATDVDALHLPGQQPHTGADKPRQSVDFHLASSDVLSSNSLIFGLGAETQTTDADKAAGSSNKLNLPEPHSSTDRSLNTFDFHNNSDLLSTNSLVFSLGAEHLAFPSPGRAPAPAPAPQRPSVSVSALRGLTAASAPQSAGSADQGGPSPLLLPQPERGRSAVGSLTGRLPIGSPTASGEQAAALSVRDALGLVRRGRSFRSASFSRQDVRSGSPGHHISAGSPVQAPTQLEATLRNLIRNRKASFSKPKVPKAPKPAQDPTMQQALAGLVKAHRGLIELDLGGWADLSTESMQQLASLPALAKLALTGCSYLEGSAVAGLTGASSLRVLDLSYTLPHTSALHAIAKLRVTELHLLFCKMAYDGTKAVQQLQKSGVRIMGFCSGDMLSLSSRGTAGVPLQPGSSLAALSGAGLGMGMGSRTGSHAKGLANLAQVLANI